MFALNLIIYLLGLSFGSFIGACAYRIPRGISITATRSFCPGCRSVLPWYDIIPVFGYVLNRGKCRTCGKRIPIADVAMELLAGGLVLLAFMQYGISLQFLFFGSLMLVLTLVAFIDWQHLIIPNKVILTGIAVGALFDVLRWQTDVLLSSLLGMAAATLILSGIMLVGNRLLRKETMGMGDIKLAGMIGFTIGLEGFLVSLWIAAAAGALFGLSCALVRGRLQDDKLPFGSFLAGSSILYMIFQTRIHEWIQLWLTSNLS
jgi:leader peptidase (prepilin peptidase) / N-methyltransferase